MSDPLSETRSSSDDIGASPNSSRALLLYTIVAIGLALAIRFFVAAPYVVSGASMEDTFYDWHYLIVDRLVYDFSSPVRGDVVVFKYPPEPNRSLIKRVIGLPGETVKISGSTVTIFNKEHPQGFTLEEPYVTTANESYSDNVNVTLGADQYFVLGDNRRVSADSRLWGALPREDITGRVDLRLFPLNKIGIVPGEYRYQGDRAVGSQ